MLVASRRGGANISGTVRRNAELDFRRAADVPLKGLDDGIVLDLAARDGRVLVSHHVSTMPDHFREFTGRSPSPGVVLIPQDLSTGAAIEGLVTICEACEAHDLENRICLLPGFVMYGF